MSSWAILGVSLFATGMALIFAVSSVLSPEAARAAIPASLAFTTIGMLGGAIYAAFKAQASRLRQLEEQSQQSGRADDAPRDARCGTRRGSSLPPP